MNNPTQAIIPTKEDREAAAELILETWSFPEQASFNALDGTADNGPTVQAFARHRVNAITRALAERASVIEECAKVAEGWPVNAAGDDYQTCGNGSFWDEGTDYDQGRADAAAAIRSLKHTPPEQPVDGEG
jgi:hypothetical protein